MYLASFPGRKFLNLVSKELLVTASDMNKCLVLWRLLLEYINPIILRKIVHMCEQCVPGRIIRPGNKATMYHIQDVSAKIGDLSTH